MRHLRTLALIDDVARSGSIRRTAERLGITPSALTRKIQEFEQELGTPIFERLSHGMRLNSAGEMVVRHARSQLADMDRVRSHIADLSGVRRGHVGIACSQAFAQRIIPDEIAAYRARHRLVTFRVDVRDHVRAFAALLEYEVDLAMVLQPPPVPEFQALFASEQPLCALMGANHELAGDGPIRLRDCFRHPLAMPDQSVAIRHVLSAAMIRAGLSCDIAGESASIDLLWNMVRRDALVTFQVSAGVPAGPRRRAGPVCAGDRQA